MVRRDRDEYAGDGVPVYTRSAEYDRYCLECASDELSGVRKRDAGLESAAAFQANERSTALEGATDSLLERQ